MDLDKNTKGLTMDNNELKPCPFCGKVITGIDDGSRCQHFETLLYEFCAKNVCDGNASCQVNGFCECELTPEQEIEQFISFWNTRACDCDKLSAVIQEISDYVFGNGLACMSGSKILESFVRHGLKVKCLEIGKTEIQSIKGE